jgi:hypothetical protein
MNTNDALDPRWASAQTLGQLGCLVAEWLEGRHAATPFYGGAPDPETASIAPMLVELNRSGFVTDFSQPAEIDEHWAQRAAVTGYCEEAIAERLASISVRGDLVVVSEPPGVDNQFQLPITREESYSYTILAGALGAAGADDDEWPWPGLNRRMRAVLLNTWYVSACDPVWGRNDLLWPALAAAMSRSVDDVRGSLIDHDYIHAQRENRED